MEQISKELIEDSQKVADTVVTDIESCDCSEEYIKERLSNLSTALHNIAFKEAVLVQFEEYEARIKYALQTIEKMIFGCVTEPYTNPESLLSKLVEKAKFNIARDKKIKEKLWKKISELGMIAYELERENNVLKGKTNKKKYLF